MGGFWLGRGVYVSWAPVMFVGVWMGAVGLGGRRGVRMGRGGKGKGKGEKKRKGEEETKQGQKPEIKTTGSNKTSKEAITQVSRT